MIGFVEEEEMEDNETREIGTDDEFMQNYDCILCDVSLLGHNRIII